MDDPITYDLLKAYLKDEEEDLFWSQGAVELIEKIGTQNWLREISRIRRILQAGEQVFPTNNTQSLKHSSR